MSTSQQWPWREVSGPFAHNPLTTRGAAPGCWDPHITDSTIWCTVLCRHQGCHTWGPLASQNQAFPSLTLVSLPPSLLHAHLHAQGFLLPSAFFLALWNLCHHAQSPLYLAISEYYVTVLTEILLRGECSSDAPCAKRLGKRAWAFSSLITATFSPVRSLLCTVCSSFDVYTTLLCQPLPVLITGMCGFPGHSKLLTKNSDMRVTASQELLSKTIPPCFLGNLSICLTMPPTC